MAKKSPTIDDVKKQKIGLEKEITELIKAFEKESGVRITYLDIKRKRDADTHVGEVPAEPQKPGPITTVDANMELDLIY